MYVSLPFGNGSYGNKTQCLTRYLEEAGMKQHYRLNQQLLETKEAALDHLQATPTSKVSTGPESF